MWFCLIKEADLEPRKNFNQKKKKKAADILTCGQEVVARTQNSVRLTGLCETWPTPGL